MRLTARTKLCALLGDPVEHSFSPLIHNAAFEEKGLDFAYLAFRVQPSNLESAVKAVRALTMGGASVTIPHKVNAISHVDRLDPVAQKIGSINTIVNEGGTLFGCNSDGSGALKAFRDRAVDLGGRSVLVLGAGGAARAVTFTLVMQTAVKEMSIAGVLHDEVTALVNNLRQCADIPIHGTAMKESLFQEHASKTDVIINCTPVGMYPDMARSPVPAGFFHKDMVVFDVVYNPPKTKLLFDAEQAGCTTISGLDMFINQAVVQFELWTGQEAPVEVMRKVVLGSLGLTKPE